MTQDPISQAGGLLQRGDVAAAVRLLTEAEAGEHGPAALMLGDLRLSGQVIRRDLAKAQSHYARAAEIGESEGRARSIALLASGPANVIRDWQGALRLLEAAGQSDDDARRQWELITEMGIDREGEPLAVPAQTYLHRA